MLHGRFYNPSIETMSAHVVPGECDPLQEDAVETFMWPPAANRSSSAVVMDLDTRQVLSLDAAVSGLPHTTPDDLASAPQPDPGALRRADTPRLDLRELHRWRQIAMGLTLIVLAQAIAMAFLIVHLQKDTGITATQVEPPVAPPLDAGATLPSVRKSPGADVTPAPVSITARETRPKVRRQPANVPVEPGGRTSLLRAASKGWVEVGAPIELEVFTNGRLLGTSSAGPLPLPPGSHRVKVQNQGIGYVGLVEVTVQPGEVSRVDPVLPTGLLQVDASPGTSVWVDAKFVGEAPLQTLRLAVGPHEVRIRRPGLEERLHRVVLTSDRPVRLDADLGP